MGPTWVCFVVAQTSPVSAAFGWLVSAASDSTISDTHTRHSFFAKVCTQRWCVSASDIQPSRSRWMCTAIFFRGCRRMLHESLAEHWTERFRNWL